MPTLAGCPRTTMARRTRLVLPSRYASKSAEEYLGLRKQLR